MTTAIWFDSSFHSSSKKKKHCRVSRLVAIVGDFEIALGSTQTVPECAKLSGKLEKNGRNASLSV